MGGGHLLQRFNVAWFKRAVPAASHGLLLLACTGFGAGLPTQVFGQGAPMPSIVSSSPEATLLRQIQQAARHLNYEGVFTFQQGESIESSRLTHVFDGQDEKERIEVLDGPSREYIRRNDEVQSLLPEQKIILREQQRGDRFPGLLFSDPAALDAHYQLRTSPEPYRVAGRPCRVIEIVPRDAHRYGYRLCADSTSNLLLKAQTLTGEGAVLEQVAFTQVTIGQAISEQALQPSWPTADWTI